MAADPLVLAVDRFTEVIDRRWTTLRNVAVAMTFALVALALALWWLWGVAQDTNHIAQRSQETQIAQACSSASARKFPRLLSDNAELARAIAWAAECNRMNGVEALPIKLPR